MGTLKIENLCKSYGKNLVLNDFSFSMNYGDIVALVGRNGAGKTTLLKCMTGIIYPDSGKILYNGEDILQNYPLLADFGILVEAVFFDYLNTYENLVLLSKASGIRNKDQIRNEVHKVLEVVGLTNHRREYVKTFSFGMKQRLGLAQTLIGDKRFLVFDEPFVGLDPIGKDQLKEVIMDKAKKDGVGVLLSSHDLADVDEICDRVVMIENGQKIHDGVVKETITYQIELSRNLRDVEKRQLIECFYDLEIVEDSIVRVGNKENLGDVIVFLTNYSIKILDIINETKATYDLFRKEIEHHGDM